MCDSCELLKKMLEVATDALEKVADYGGCTHAPGGIMVGSPDGENCSCSGCVAQRALDVIERMPTLEVNELKIISLKNKIVRMGALLSMAHAALGDAAKVVDPSEDESFAYEDTINAIQEELDGKK